MTKVILVRHGITLWNRELRYQGHTDISLAEEGVLQAEKVAKRLARERITAIYASDLGRAAETARHVAVWHGLPVTLLPAIREINFGHWEGKSHAELQGEERGKLNDWFNRPAEIQIPQGESFQQVKERAYTALLEAVRRHRGETIAAVSHGGTIRAIICAALGINLNKLWCIKQDNTAVNVLEFHKQSVEVALINDTHHLNV